MGFHQNSWSEPFLTKPVRLVALIWCLNLHLYNAAQQYDSYYIVLIHPGCCFGSKLKDWKESTCSLWQALERDKQVCLIISNQVSETSLPLNVSRQGCVSSRNGFKKLSRRLSIEHQHPSLLDTEVMRWLIGDSHSRKLLTDSYAEFFFLQFILAFWRWCRDDGTCGWWFRGASICLTNSEFEWIGMRI